jgi:hypothetical protein
MARRLVRQAEMGEARAWTRRPPLSETRRERERRRRDSWTRTRAWSVHEISNASGGYVLTSDGRDLCRGRSRDRVHVDGRCHHDRDHRDRFGLLCRFDGRLGRVLVHPFGRDVDHCNVSNKFNSTTRRSRRPYPSQK